MFDPSPGDPPGEPAEAFSPPHAASRMPALLERIKLRDRSALDTLYKTYAPRVQSYALQLLKDRQAAEDLTQEVFLRVWRYAGSYHATRSTRPEAWLFQIVRNKAFTDMGVRSRDVSLEALQEDGEALDEVDAFREGTDARSADPVAEWADNRAYAQVQRLLQSLPSHYRQVVYLRFHMDLTNPEIAEHLGVPLGTAKTWLRRSLIQMRDELGATASDRQN